MFPPQQGLPQAILWKRLPYLCLLPVSFSPSAHHLLTYSILGLPWWLSGEESTCQCRIHWSLIRENLTSLGATKPKCHNYWTCALEPRSHNYWAQVLQLLKPTCLEPVSCNKRSHPREKPITTVKSGPHLMQLEKACTYQGEPSATKD